MGIDLNKYLIDDVKKTFSRLFVLAVHQSAVSHNHEIIAYALTLSEVVIHRYHSVALVLLAVEQAV